MKLPSLYFYSDISTTEFVIVANGVIELKSASACFILKTCCSILLTMFQGIRFRNIGCFWRKNCCCFNFFLVIIWFFYRCWNNMEITSLFKFMKPAFVATDDTSSPSSKFLPFFKHELDFFRYCVLAYRSRFDHHVILRRYGHRKFHFRKLAVSMSNITVLSERVIITSPSIIFYLSLLYL